MRVGQAHFAFFALKKIKCEWAKCNGHFQTENDYEKHVELHEILKSAYFVHRYDDPYSSEESSQNITPLEIQKDVKFVEVEEPLIFVTCEYCGNRYITRDFKNHNCLKCTICNLQCKTVKEMNKHLIENHAKCPFCEKQGKGKPDQMKMHVQQKHFQEYKALYEE